MKKAIFEFPNFNWCFPISSKSIFHRNHFFILILKYYTTQCKQHGNQAVSIKKNILSKNQSKNRAHCWQTVWFFFRFLGGFPESTGSLTWKIWSKRVNNPRNVFLKMCIFHLFDCCLLILTTVFCVLICHIHLTDAQDHS